MSVGVIGGGAWGTAIAQVAAANGDPVMLWAREDSVVADVNTARENKLFLSGVTLSASITATSDLADLRDCDTLFVVVPAQHVRNVLNLAHVNDRPLVLCSKGIEAGTQMLMSEIVHAMFPTQPVAVLSGPTFAREVALSLPTAVTVASKDRELAHMIARRIARPHFRPYVSSDVIGTEVGGAVKNVLAIACGVVDGRGLGQNATAALIARGFAEMSRFGLAKGAQPETLGGLSGLGDLVLTCSSRASRNHSLGRGIGLGRSRSAIMAEQAGIAEGAFTAPVLQSAAQALGVEMPVVDAVCALLQGDVLIDEMIGALLARPLRGES